MADFTSNGSVLDKKSKKEMHPDTSFILCFVEKEGKDSISSNKKNQRGKSVKFLDSLQSRHFFPSWAHWLSSEKKTWLGADCE